MASAVAAVAEETGFRGYMQLSLERAYGPVTAIVATSVVFTLIHLTHGPRILPFLPFFLVVSVVYGLLTFFTGSILPAMTLHFVGDAVMFSLRFMESQRGVAGGPGDGTISWGAALVSVAFAALSIAVFRILARERRATAPVAPAPAMA